MNNKCTTIIENDGNWYIAYCKSFLDSVERGISDAECGRTYSTEEVRALLTSKRKMK
jgi:hypothetical protein